MDRQARGSDGCPAGNGDHRAHSGVRARVPSQRKVGGPSGRGAGATGSLPRRTGCRGWMGRLMTPMKLVHLTTVPQSLGFLRGQAGFMKARGFEVHAISSPGVLLERFREMEEAETHAVQMARRITPLRDAATLLKVFSWLMWMRPTIVQAHTPKAGLIGMLAAAAA